MVAFYAINQYKRHKIIGIAACNVSASRPFLYFYFFFFYFTRSSTAILFLNDAPVYT